MVKLFIIIFIDLLLAIFSVWIAYYLRLGEFVNLFIYYDGYFPINAVIGSVIFLLPIFLLSGLYRTVIRFSSWPEIQGIAKGILIYGVCFFILFSLIRVEGVPRTIGIIQPLVLFF